MRESFSHFLRPLMWLLAIVFVFGAVMIVGMPAFTNRGEKAKGDEVVATVNGINITKIQLAQAQEDQLKAMRSSGNNLSPLQRADMMVDIMNQMLLEKLKLSAAKQQGIGAGYFEIGREKKKMINDQIEYVRAMLSQGKKVKPTDAEIDMMLKSVNPPTSLAQIRKDADQQLTRDRVREALMVRKLEDKAKAKVGTIDDKKVEQIFQQYKVRQIVVRETGMPGAQTERRANEVLKKLQSGADFAAVAKEFSDDPLTKNKGGDMDWVSVAQDQDLQKLSKGKLSGVIKSPMYGGYRIVYVEDVKTELPKDYVIKKADYRKGVQQFYEQQEVQKLYADIEKTAKIEIKDPEMRGYWLAKRVNMAPSASERSKVIDEAIATLQKAIASGGDFIKDGPRAKMAELYIAKGDNEKAIKELNQIVNVEHVYSSDLALMLGKLYVKKGDNAKAIKQLELAEATGYGNPSVQSELKSLWKEVGQPERAAKAEKWLADYQKRMGQQQGGSVPVRATP
jgi:parvulin-like peptidyl-prolyl isomerase